MCLGIPGRIVDVHDPEHCLAMVEVSGVRREINIACIVDASHAPAACLGDWVLVHVGFAMGRIDEAEAARTLELLTMMGDVQAELEALRSQGSEGPLANFLDPLGGPDAKRQVWGRS